MNWKSLLIEEGLSIKDTLKRMDIGGKGILFVVDENGNFLGVITDGDIRRHILARGKLEDNMEGVYNSDPTYIEEGYTKEDAEKVVLRCGIEILPIVNKKRCIVGAISWTELFEEKSVSVSDKISVPVVIMAGGKGERMNPFTKILPKPLVPIGEKPIIELIIDKFTQNGFQDFYITLNYKGEMIKTYMESICKNYTLDYIWEEEYLGTAGSLKLLPPETNDTLIISNSDIIVEADYNDLLTYHRESENLLTVVGSIQHHTLPYGVIHFEKKGRIQRIHEKPEYDFMVNTGVYVLSKEAIDFIPENKSFHMTDLVSVLLEADGKLGVYPVSQKSYIDIGQWEEYKSYLEKLGNKFLV